MSDGPKIPRSVAVKVGRELMAVLQQHCSEFVFAGSLRRGAAEVGDIEIVCMPVRVRVAGLLEDTWEVSPLWIAAVENAGRIVKGSPSGRYCKLVRTYESLDSAASEFKVDIFMPQAHDYGRQVAIRTGPHGFSVGLAVMWRNLGWVGTEDGLRRMDQCEEKSWGWICKAKNPVLPPEFKTERTFFEFLRYPFPEPKDRIG